MGFPCRSRATRRTTKTLDTLTGKYGNTSPPTANTNGHTTATPFHRRKVTCSLRTSKDLRCPQTRPVFGSYHRSNNPRPTLHTPPAPPIYRRHRSTDDQLPQEVALDRNIVALGEPRSQNERLRSRPKQHLHIESSSLSLPPFPLSLNSRSAAASSAHQRKEPPTENAPPAPKNGRLEMQTKMQMI